jgi:hypothetical protein
MKPNILVHHAQNLGVDKELDCRAGRKRWCKKKRKKKRVKEK